MADYLSARPLISRVVRSIRRSRPRQPRSKRCTRASRSSIPIRGMPAGEITRVTRVRGAARRRAPGSRTRLAAPTSEATLDEVVAHVAALVGGNEHADLGRPRDGYGSDPRAAAEAIVDVAEAGAVSDLDDHFGPPARDRVRSRSRGRPRSAGELRRDECSDMRDDFIERRFAVGAARASTRLRSSSLRAPRTRVRGAREPRIRDDERLASCSASDAAALAVLRVTRSRHDAVDGTCANRAITSIL